MLINNNLYTCVWEEYNLIDFVAFENTVGFVVTIFSNFFISFSSLFLSSLINSLSYLICLSIFFAFKVFKKTYLCEDGLSKENGLIFVVLTCTLSFSVVLLFFVFPYNSSSFL